MTAGGRAAGGRAAGRKAGGDAAGGVEARLRILATTDLHLHLLPYDYYADRPLPATGLALAATLIRALRAEALAEGRACLLLDNGDFLQGTLLSDWLADEGRDVTRPAAPGGAPGRASGGAGHPMIAAFGALGLDATTLGNHEFNYGLPYLREALAGAAFPVVSANLVDDEGGPLVAPWAILDRGGTAPDGRPWRLRIGVLGFAPPQVTSWDRLILGGRVAALDIVEAARAAAPRVRAAGADIVVALCHSGIGAAAAQPMMENAAVPLAGVDGIDVVVAGHTHVVFPGAAVAATAAVDPVAGTLHGKPAVQPGAYGSHVGVIDLTLRRDGGRWRIEHHRVRAVPVAPAPAIAGGGMAGGGMAEGATAAPWAVDAAIAAIAAPSHRRLLEAARRPVGRTEVALESYFALVAGSAALDVVADALRAHAARALDGTAHAGLPILAAVAPFKAGGRGGPGHYIDIPPGPLALRQAAELYVHPNSFVVLEVTGAGLAAWLERSASIFATLVPGATDQPLLDPTFPSYSFDVIDGLTWTIDPSRPPRTDAEGRLIDPCATRVRDLAFAGRPVGAADRFALVTNSYRMGSGGGFVAGAPRAIAQSPRTVRDIVLAHVRAGPLRPAPRPRWRFAAMPGTAAWFDSGPAAARHMAGRGERSLTPLAPTEAGFLRFLLRL